MYVCMHVHTNTTMHIFPQSVTKCRCGARRERKKKQSGDLEGGHAARRHRETADGEKAHGEKRQEEGRQ